MGILIEGNWMKWDYVTLALVDMYGKCDHNVVSWTANELWKDMLSAALGLVDEAFYYLNTMMKEVGITPGKEHYTCMEKVAFAHAMIIGDFMWLLTKYKFKHANIVFVDDWIGLDKPEDQLLILFCAMDILDESYITKIILGGNSISLPARAHIIITGAGIN
ncbi:hypothetical protein ACJX0J_029873, partial [Zea mays]